MSKLSLYDFIKNHQEDAVVDGYYKNCQRVIDFIEQVYEIAYGDDAVFKGYSEQKVLKKLGEFRDKGDVIGMQLDEIKRLKAELTKGGTHE